MLASASATMCLPTPLRAVTGLAMYPHREAYSCCSPAHIQDELLLAFDGLPYSWKHSVALLLVLVTKLSAISVLLFLRPRHHLANGGDQKQQNAVAESADEVDANP